VHKQYGYADRRHVATEASRHRQHPYERSRGVEQLARIVGRGEPFLGERDAERNDVDRHARHVDAAEREGVADLLFCRAAAATPLQQCFAEARHRHRRERRRYPCVDGRERLSRQCRIDEDEPGDDVR